MKNGSKAKILLLPIIVAIATALSLQFIEQTFDSESELIHFTMFENLVIFVMTFLSVYLFTIILVVPTYILLAKKLESKIVLFILMNVIGLILVACIDVLVIKNIELKSLYLIFPLYAFLSLFQLSSKRD